MGSVASSDGVTYDVAGMVADDEFGGWVSADDHFACFGTFPDVFGEDSGFAAGSTFDSIARELLEVDLPTAETSYDPETGTTVHLFSAVDGSLAEVVGFVPLADGSVTLVVGFANAADPDALALLDSVVASVSISSDAAGDASVVGDASEGQGAGEAGGGLISGLLGGAGGGSSAASDESAAPGFSDGTITTGSGTIVDIAYFEENVRSA